MYNMVPVVGEGAPPLSLNNAQYASNFVPEAGQVCYIKDLGFFKIGDGVTTWASLSYMPRRWSATATNPLATTNGDGVEKTVGSIVIPANTLAADGDVVDLTFRATYLNNTGSSQTPQFGISLNTDADLWLSSAAGQNVATSATAKLVTAILRMARTSATTCNFDAVLTTDGASAWSVSWSAYGTWNWNGTERRIVGIDLPVTWASQNTVNFKALLAAYGTPALHQIAGLAGRGILLT